MKVFIVTVAVLIFAVLMGCLTFALMGSEGVEAGTTDDLLKADRMGDAEGMVTRLVTSIVVAAVIGSLLIIFVLPKFALMLSNVVYDQSPQKFVEPNSLDAGRSLKLQGKFEEAIEMFELAIEEDEPDRLAWVEIAQIQEEDLEDADAAIETLKEGRDAHEWEMDDDVNFITRIASLELEHRDGRDAAVELYKEMLELYGQNEYHANSARNSLMELDISIDG